VLGLFLMLGLVSVAVLMVLLTYMFEKTDSRVPFEGDKILQVKDRLCFLEQ